MLARHCVLVSVNRLCYQYQHTVVINMLNVCWNDVHWVTSGVS